MLNPMDTFKEIKNILDRNNLRIVIQNGTNCCIVTTPELHFPAHIEQIITKFTYEDKSVIIQRFKNSLLTDEKKIECPTDTRKLITLLFFVDLCGKFGFPHQYAKFVLNEQEVDKQEFYEKACWQTSDKENIIMKAAEGTYTEEELKKLNVFDDYQFVASLFTSKS